MFSVFKEGKREGKKKEGRKETKQGSEGKQHRGNSQAHKQLRKLHFRDICLCARLEKWSCGQQDFSAMRGGARGRVSCEETNNYNPQGREIQSFRLMPMFIAYLCPRCLPSAMSTSQKRLN